MKKARSKSRKIYLPWILACCYKPSTQICQVSRDIVFNEMSSWYEIRKDELDEYVDE